MKKATKKIVALLLSVLMVVTIIPFGAISVSALSESGLVKIESDVETDYGFLGWTFNALSSDLLDDETDFTATSIFDYSELEAYVMGDANQGVISQGATVEFASSAKEMMQKLGIETSSSAKGKVGISKAKVGFESKFSAELDYTTESKVEELFYYYVYRAICENYRLKTSSSYSEYLSEDFMTVINNVNPNNANSIKNFFDTYGTHVLIQYDKGAQMSLSASAISTSESVKLKASLSSSISASVSAGSKASAEAANKVAFDFKNESNNESVNAQTKWHTDGGDKAYCNNFSGESISVNEQGVENWIASINGGNTVFLPETSKWIAIWEVIPNTAEYAVLREALYNYYLEQEITQNTDFFSRYISYSEFTDGTIATYVNPNGYTSLVIYKANMSVAPGSTIKVPISDIENYELVEYKVMSDNAAAEKSGVVKISSNATDKVIIQVYGDYLPIATLSFSVIQEGNNGMFAGGYGTTERPYLISENDQLKSISNFPNKHFLLIKDIDYENNTWTPFVFTGTLNGSGYTISNLKIRSASSKIGLFSQLSCEKGEDGSIINAGEVKNLNFNNINIIFGESWIGSSANDIGVIAGFVDENALIDNCSVTNSLISASYGYSYDQRIWIGGIAGISQGTIKNCNVATTSLKGYAKGDSCRYNSYIYIGGIVGKIENGEENISTVEHSASYDNTIYGYIYTYGYKKEKDYSDGTFYLGSLVGEIYNEGELKNSAHYNNSISYERGCYDHWGWEDWPYNRTTVAINSDNYGCVGKVHTGLSSSNEENSNKTQYTDPITNIVATNSKTFYYVGETFDPSTITVDVVKQNGSKVENVTHYIINGFDSSSAGTNEITISYYFGNSETPITQKLPLEIREITIDKIEIVSSPAQTEYYVGDSAFNKAGLSIEAVYSNGDRKNVTDKIVVTGFNTSTATENQVITFSYTEENISYSASQNIKISNVVPFKIEMDTLPKKTNYAEGEAFDGSGCVVKVYYNNGTAQTSSQNLSYSGFESNVTGTQTITVLYSNNSIAEELSTTFEVNVGTIRSIAVKSMPTKTQYYVGDSKKGIDTTGLVLTATYSNGVTVDVSSGYTVSNLNAAIANTWETVTVSLFGKQTTFQVYINAVELVSIEVDRLPQTQYFVGDTFSSVGLRVKAIYNNGDVKLKQSSDCELLIGNIDANRYIFTSAGSKTVSVDYYENNKSATTTFDVNAVAVKLDRLEIAKQPTKISYKAGESIDTTGMIVNAIYNNGDIVNITNSIDSIVCDLTTVGNKEAVVWYNNISTSFDITVMSPSHISVTTLPSKMLYNYGELFDYTGMIVTAYYPDGSQKQLNSSEYEIETIQSGTDGNVTVNVDYLDRSDSFHLTVLMPTIDVDIVSARAGKTVSVDISINNNPGILGASFTVAFDDRLTLLSTNNGDALSTLSYTAPGELSNPCSFGWDGIDVADTSNGVVLTLTFLVPDDAEIGDSYAISVSYDEGSIFDDKMGALGIDIINGSIEILDYTAGDLNDDGMINMQDVVLLRRYIVGGYDVDLNFMAADVNHDDVLNMQDVVLIRRYIVGGYGVELQ